MKGIPSDSRDFVIYIEKMTIVWQNDNDDDNGAILFILAFLLFLLRKYYLKILSLFFSFCIKLCKSEIGKY